MKKQILLLTLSLLSLLSASARGKVMKNPELVFNSNSAMEIVRVELQDTATFVFVRCTDSSRFPRSLYLSRLDDGNGGLYKWKGVKDKGKEAAIKDVRNNREFTLVFEPMPRDVAVFDLIPSIADNGINVPRWYCWGIHDSKTTLDIPRRDLTEATRRLLNRRGSGTTTVKGRYTPAVEGTIWEGEFRLVGKLGAENWYTPKPFVINPDSTFSYTVDLKYPTRAYLEIGSPFGNTVPLFLEPGKDVTVNLEQALNQNCRLSVSTEGAGAGYMLHQPMLWSALLPNHYKNDVKALFIDSQDYIDSLRLLSDYIIDRHGLSDEDAALMKSEMMHCLYKEQVHSLLYIKQKSGQKQEELLDYVFNTVLADAEPRVKKYIDEMLYDETYALGLSQSSDIPQFFGQLLQYGSYLNYKSVPLAEFVSDYYDTTDSQLRQILHYSQTPPFFKFCIASALYCSLSFAMYNPSDLQTVIDVFAKKSGNPALAQYMGDWIECSFRYRIPFDVSSYPGYDVLQRITARHRGKYVAIVPLMQDERNVEEPFHTLLDNLIHDFKDSPDVAIVFIVNEDFTTQDKFDRMRSQYLRNYPDVHLLPAIDYYHLSYMAGQTSEGFFHSMALSRDGKVMPIGLFNLPGSNNNEYYIRCGIRQLLEAEKIQGNK